ncbi:DUF3040 domain-containing protein [Demetria terragena]|uniref:DUF3040 domain-containing protein n=1 Tax=Demetria terragena TaxID=63959 RepID=UPI00058F42E7|nr:DUF3040 domain-containing protein [Demetria terragena]
MPLSEHEQRLLDQMEQQLYDDDPKLAGRLAEDPGHARTRTRLVLGALTLLLGLGVVLLGVGSSLVWVGGIGFALMVAGAVYAMTPGQKKATLGTVTENGDVKKHSPRSAGGLSARFGRSGSGSSSARSGTFMQRMEERWERRRREGGGW